MKALLVAAVLALWTLASGCASIVSGSNQSLSVEAIQKGQMVAGATCKLTNDKGTWFVNTPGTVTVRRSYDDLNVRCEKDKIDPGIVVAKSSTKAMMFGNILFGGIIGGAVDAGTGAGYDYPSVITVEMAASTTIDVPKAAEQADASMKPPATDPKAQPSATRTDGQTSDSQEPKRAGVISVGDSAKPPAVMPLAGEQSGTSEVVRLKKLKDLLDAGLITGAEYEAKKAEILRGM